MCKTGEFKKHDKGSDDANIEKHGQPEPPQYNLKNITGFNIHLICGKTDLLASPTDYIWLYEELLENKNNVEMIEHEAGHLGLILPDNEQVGAVNITDDML